MSQPLQQFDQQELPLNALLKYRSSHQLQIQRQREHLFASPCRSSARKNNENDLFCFNSLYTISRQSLQYLPESYNSDLYTKYDQNMVQILKSSIKSLQYSEKQNQGDNVCETQLPNELGIKMSESSIVEDIQNKNQTKVAKPIKVKEKDSTHVIKQTKHLIRHLRRESKSNKGNLKGDFYLSWEDGNISISGGEVNCIMNEKGRICGVLIMDGDLEHKIRIEREGNDILKMQLWNKEKYEWNEFTFKVKLYHTL